MDKDIVIDEIAERKNPLCVISKDVFGPYNVRSIQTNSMWSDNPYGEDYAIVPDDMVESILETNGFCDIELCEDGTTIVSFTPKEIPEIEEVDAEPTQLDLIEAQVTYTAMMTDTLLGV